MITKQQAMDLLPTSKLYFIAHDVRWDENVQCRPFRVFPYSMPQTWNDEKRINDFVIPIMPLIIDKVRYDRIDRGNAHQFTTVDWTNWRTVCELARLNASAPVWAVADRLIDIGLEDVAELVLKHPHYVDMGMLTGTEEKT